MRAYGQAIVTLDELELIVRASTRELEHLETQAERDAQRAALRERVNGLAVLLED